MTTTYPEEIQTIIDKSEKESFEDVRNSLDEADQTLTSLLTSDDTCDFVVTDEAGHVWLFAENSVLGTWEVSYAGKPIYQIDSAMIGDPDIDTLEFAKALRHHLEGVTVWAMDASNGAMNHRSEFYEVFKYVLDAVFDDVLNEF